MTASVVNTSATPITWSGGGGPTTPAIPTDTAAGMLLLLSVMARSTGVDINTEDGYTLLSGDDQDQGTAAVGEIQGKIAGSSESAPSVTSSILDTQPTCAFLIAITGWSGNLEDITVSTPNVGTDDDVPAPDATATFDDTLVIRVYMQADDNTVLTAPSGHSPIFFQNSIQGSDACMAAYVMDDPINASDSAGVANAVFSGSDPYLAYTILIPPTQGNIPLSTLSDDFNDNSIDTSKWSANYGTIAETGGQAQVEVSTGFSGWKSSAVYALDSDTDQGFLVRVIQLPAASTATAATLTIGIQSETLGSYLAIILDSVSGFMGLYAFTGFSDPDAVFIAYNATNHRYARIRYIASSDEVAWEFSADGVTYTPERTDDAPAYIVDATTLSVFIEGHRDAGDTDTAIFDDVNTGPIVLAPNDTEQGQTSENVTISVDSVDLVVADTAQGQTSESVTLTQVHALTVADTAQGQTAESLSLTQVHVLSIQDTEQGQLADSPVLTQVHILAVQDTSQSQRADHVSLTVGDITTPEERTIMVDSENRTINVSAEQRTIVVEAESRVVIAV